MRSIIMRSIMVILECRTLYLINKKDNQHGETTVMAKLQCNIIYKQIQWKCKNQKK